MTQDAAERKERRTPSDYAHGASQWMGNACRHVQYGGDDGLDWLGVVLWILVVALVIGGLLAAWIGINPWVQVAGGMLKGMQLKLLPNPVDGAIAENIVVGLIRRIAPFIQWGLAGLAVFLSWKNGGWNSVLFVVGLIILAALGGVQLAVGFVLWAIVQALILQWILFAFDKYAMHGTLLELDQINASVGNQKRNRQGRGILKRLQHVPTAWLQWSGILGLGAVAVDLWVNISTYPPTHDGKLETFTSAISLGRWAQIDWEALRMIAISMAGFEAAIILVFVIKQWLEKRELGKTA
jgi:hypothetical protein